MPFAVETPPPPVIVLGIVLGAMIVGWILDRIARAAGVRRFKGWDYMAAVVTAGVGGYFGMIDGDERGIAVGAVIGFIAGALIASVAFGVLATIWSFFVGPPLTEEEKNGSKKRRVSIVRRFAILIFGCLPVAFAALVAHEVYWLANLGAVSLQAETGKRMFDYANREEPMKELAAAMSERRWQVESVAQRPADWVVHDDYKQSNAEVLTYYKLFSGDKPPKDFPDSWNEKDPSDLLMFAAWSTPDFSPAKLDTELVRTVGMRISNRRVKLFNEILDRTLALRYVPRDLFIREPKEVKKKKQPDDDGEK